MKKNFFLSILFFICLFSIAHAQNGEIIVTATRNEAKIASTPSYVEVITSKQLKKDGYIYVKNALKNLEGISISSNGVFGGTTSLYVRGLSSYYTKILIDGVDVSDVSLMQPYYDLSNLTVDDIDRIEIVQGSQSGLYGANAIAGVINIITKSGKGKPSVEYSQTIGSYATFKETLTTKGKKDNFDFYVQISKFDTHGISKMDSLNSDNKTYSKGKEKDAYYKNSVYAKFGYGFEKGFYIGAIIDWYGAKDYLDNGWSPAYQPDDSIASNQTDEAKKLRVDTKFLMTKLYAKKDFDRLYINTDIFYVQNFRYNKSAPPSWLNYKGKRWGFDAIAVYDLKSTKVTGGLTYKKERYEDTSPFKKDRYNYGLFAEVEHNIGNLKVQTVAREDFYETFGNHFTYKVGLNYLVDKTGTILKANYSTGFRAPSIYELHAPPIDTWGFLGGNKDLKPEHAKTWGFGFSQNLLKNRLSLNATYFRSIIKDRISYYTDTSTWQSTYKNMDGKTIASGIELGIKARPTNYLTIGANYTYTKSKDPNTKKQTARVPLFVVNGFVNYETLNNKLNLALNGRYVGKRFDDAAHFHQTGKYAVFDFSMLYKFNNNLTTSLYLRNIFDRFYQDVYGYSTMPRSIFAKVSYKF